MGELTEVALELCVPRRFRHLDIPAGFVYGIEANGTRSRCLRPTLGRTTLTVLLPRIAALEAVAFHRQHIAGKDKYYNCLAHMSRVAFNRAPWAAELYMGIGPRLIEGRYRVVDTDEVLKPGVGYVFAGDGGYIDHGAVGIGVPDRQLEVGAHKGPMQVASTERTRAKYENIYSTPFTVAEVGPSSYASSEPRHPLSVSVDN